MPQLFYSIAKYPTKACDIEIKICPTINKNLLGNLLTVYREIPEAQKLVNPIK